MADLERELIKSEKLESFLTKLFPEGDERKEEMSHELFNTLLAQELVSLPKSPDLKKSGLKHSVDQLYSSYCTIHKNMQKINELKSRTPKEVEGFFANMRESIAGFLNKVKIYWKEAAKTHAEKKFQTRMHKVIDVYTSEKITDITGGFVNSMKKRYYKVKGRAHDVRIGKDLKKVARGIGGELPEGQIGLRDRADLAAGLEEAERETERAMSNDVRSEEASKIQRVYREFAKKSKDGRPRSDAVDFSTSHQSSRPTTKHVPHPRSSYAGAELHKRNMPSSKHRNHRGGHR